MKVTKLVHPSHARSITSEHDAARLRAQGWLELDQTKPVSKAAARQRLYRNRCKRQGQRFVSVWLPDEVHAALIGARKPKESVPALIERLLNELGLL